MTQVQPRLPDPRPDGSYDYHEVRDWLNHMYERDDRDVLGKFNGNIDAEYRDFWHFVCENAEIHNGCIFTMYEEWAEDAEDWQKEIIEQYMKNFGTGNDGDREIQFWVEW